jgi:hypothetical protein
MKKTGCLVWKTVPRGLSWAVGATGKLFLTWGKRKVEPPWTVLYKYLNVINSNHRPSLFFGLHCPPDLYQLGDLTQFILFSLSLGCTADFQWFISYAIRPKAKYRFIQPPFYCFTFWKHYLDKSCIFLKVCYMHHFRVLEEIYLMLLWLQKFMYLHVIVSCRELKRIRLEWPQMA